MFNIEIADLVISLDNKHSYVKKKCLEYITNKNNNTGITLSVSKERMLESIDYKLDFDGEKISFPEAEYDAIHYDLYSKLYKYNGFWLHSVLIQKDGVGYLFSAKPGVGKTTHAKLWLEAFDDAIIVNGDNTIIRQGDDGVFYGYGTPFCGKEGFNINKKVPIKAICFLERSNNNYVEKIKPMDAIMRMFKENWCIRKSSAAKAMDLYTLLAKQVQFYKVYCNTDIESAVITYQTISNKQ